LTSAGGQTTAGTASQTPGGTAEAWTADTLKPGLLTVKDLPAGYRLDPSTDSADSSDEGKYSSKQAGCADLVKFLNAGRPTGAQASAKVSFMAGTQAPALEDELHGMPTADAAQTAITEFAAAVKTCTSLAMGDPTLSMTVKVSALPAPALGEKAMAFQLEITSGPVAGTIMTGIRVSTGRVVTDVRASSPSANIKQATDAARTATARVQSTLGAQATG
jgi:hypothetical protein